MPHIAKPRTVKKYGPTVRRYLKLQTEIKRNYERSDELFVKLLEKLRPGDRVPIGEGKFARLKDNFAEKNKVYRAHGISRYELEVVEA